MAPTPQIRATRLWVERTFPLGDTQFEDKNVEIRVFETQPASVSAKAGRTINLGNYESVRIEVGVSIPCYAEEVEVGLEAASSLVGQFLAQEEAKLKAILNNG